MRSHALSEGGKTAQAERDRWILYCRDDGKRVVVGKSIPRTRWGETVRSSRCKYKQKTDGIAKMNWLTFLKLGCSLPAGLFQQGETEQICNHAFLDFNIYTISSKCHVMSILAELDVSKVLNKYPWKMIIMTQQVNWSRNKKIPASQLLVFLPPPSPLVC